MVAACLMMLALQDAALTGKVTLSDGTTIEGELRLTRGRKLSLYETSLKKRYELALEEIARLSVTPEKEEMAQGWRFLEESSDKKVKLAYQYPLRTLLTEVTLATGQVLRGHVQAAPLYVKRGDEETKHVLLWEQKGEKDQKLEDLLYVREVALSEPPARGELCALKVSAPGALEIRAVDVARDRSFESRDGRIAGLLKGRYDLVARTPKEIVYGLTVEKDELADQDRKDLQARVSSIEEFFNEKEVKVAAGTAVRAKVLVEMRRTTPSHAKDKEGRPYGTIRWELWTLRKVVSTWEIEARVFLFREQVEPGKPLPKPAFRALGAMAGIEVESGTREIKVVLE